jgi:hypothetical protein
MSCDCERGNFSAVEFAKSIGRVVNTGLKTAFVLDYDPLVSEEIQQKRLEACRACDKHTVTMGKLRCTVCGCFLQAKTSLKDQVCPHPDGPKWQQEP